MGSPPKFVHMQAAQLNSLIGGGRGQEGMKVGMGVVGKDLRGSKLIIYKSEKNTLKYD